MLNEQIQTELVYVTPAAAGAVQDLMTKRRLLQPALYRT